MDGDSDLAAPTLVNRVMQKTAFNSYVMHLPKAINPIIEKCTLLTYTAAL
jgi:hypothetical protein